jgi:hypothetical protein
MASIRHRFGIDPVASDVALHCNARAPAVAVRRRIVNPRDACAADRASLLM